MDSTEKVVEDSIQKMRLWHRFHLRLTAVFGGAVLLTLVAMGVLAYQIGVSTEVDGLRQRLRAVVTSLAETVPAAEISQIPVENTELTTLHETLLEQFKRIAQSDPDIDSIYVLRPTLEPTKLRFLVDFTKREKQGVPGETYSAKGLPVLLRGFEEVSVEERPFMDEFGLTLSGYAPVFDAEGHAVAVVGIDVLVDRINILKQRVATATLWLFGIAVAFVSILSLLVAGSIRKPLSLMVRAATAISQGDFSTRVSIHRNDEFGVLASHFDHMAADLKEREFLRDTFGRYVSKDVASAVLAGGVPDLGGEERVVTILFIDLKNYTTISERLSPVQMVEMLNRYLAAMSEVIDRHRGCVIEFLGDAILAVFGAPHYFIEHAEEAVKCAAEMRERLAELNQEWADLGFAVQWQRNGVEKIEARVGIHTGPVVVGNLGSPSRMKYAVIGDSVNVAARLETLNKDLGTSILLSDDVKSRLSGPWVERVTDHGEHSVKGRSQKVRIFSV